MATTTLRKVGGSAITTVPSLVSDFLKVAVGDKIEWAVENDRIVVKASRPVRKKLRLDDLLDKFEAAQTVRTPEDEQWLSSSPVGKELL